MSVRNLNEDNDENERGGGGGRERKWRRRRSNVGLEGEGEERYSPASSVSLPSSTGMVPLNEFFERSL